MAVQLRNTLGKILGHNLSATLLFDYPTIQALTDFLASEVLSSRSPEELGAGLHKDEGRGDEGLPDIEELSQEQLAGLLADKIAKITGEGLRDN
jgi:hypothetical protein